MKTKISIAAFLLFTAFSYSQQLVYKPGGKVFTSENSKMPSSEVKQLLATHPELLNLYQTGRTKKTMGSILMVGGVLFLAGDLLKGLTADEKYPSSLTYIGGALIVVSIPIKAGYPKKIRSAIDGYNEQLYGNNGTALKNISFLSTTNGLGVRLTF